MTRLNQPYTGNPHSTGTSRAVRGKRHDKMRFKRTARSSSDSTNALLRNASIGYLVLVVGLLWLLRSVSEAWWLGTALTYLPGSLFVFPALLLAGWAFSVCRKFVWVNLVSVLLVLGPLMNFQISPANLFTTSAGGPELKVVSCNVQEFEPDFMTVLSEISVVNPDIVLLQEAKHPDELLGRYFEDWHVVHYDEFWIGSRYPLKLVGVCDSSIYQRTTAVAVEVDDPNGKYHLVNVHLMTARFGLRGMHPRALLSGEGIAELEEEQYFRHAEARETRIFVSQLEPAMPVVIAGDFNTPDFSSLFDGYWGDFGNAFDEVGFGYGYTAPNARLSFWPAHTPWVRIDHILASSEWQFISSKTGRKNGSDHRLISATLQRQ